jgi:pimeloyl-ACP methyl ester carboxylesterase
MGWRSLQVHGSGAEALNDHWIWSLPVDRRSLERQMLDADLLLIHGFWSSPATWDPLTQSLSDDAELVGLRVHAFGYESPKLPRLRWWPARIPDYDDIAQSLPAFLTTYAPGSAPIAIVTHSQGGLILQRFLAWMLTEGRANELARIRLIILLSCPNRGSEYLSSIRAAIGFSRHPQAGQLTTLNQKVADARRIVLRQIVNATTHDDRQCPVPFYVYSGRTDNVVSRESAQDIFPNAEVLPGNHSSILNPSTPGNLTAAIIKRHLLNITPPPNSHSIQASRSAVFATRTDGSSRPASQIPAIWNMPRQNPRFTGREDQIEQLRAALAPRGEGAGRGGSLVQAIDGLGGVGKSQIAIQYAYLFASDYEIVWWIDAERPELIGTQLAQLGVRAGWIAPDTGVEAAWPLINDRLRATPGWLLIFDNASAPDHVKLWLPQPPIEGRGDVLITSRHKGWSEIAAQIHIGVFNRSESVALLTELVPAMRPENADALAERLGDLALGLVQAAGFIAETSMPVSNYLIELQRGTDVFDRGTPTNYSVTLGAAVRLNLERLAELAPPALTLMRLVALLAPEPVPIGWLTEIPEGDRQEILGPDLALIASKPLLLRQTLAHAANLGLLVLTEGHIQVHRITQAIIRAELRAIEFDEYSTKIALLLAVNHPGGAAGTMPTTWSAWAGMLPHLLVLDPSHAPPPARTVLADAVWYQVKNGNYYPAGSLGERLYLAWNKSLGRRDPHTLAAAFSLAYAYRAFGEYEKAEVLDRGNYEIYSDMAGPNSYEALHTQIHLANDLHGLDRPQEALNLLLSTDEVRREALRNDPRSRLGADLNIAVLLFELERHSEAIVRISKAKDGLDRELGHDDPDSLNTTGQKAIMMWKMGDRVNALPLLHEAVEAMGRTLGVGHSTTRRYAEHLAIFLDEIEV